MGRSWEAFRLAGFAVSPAQRGPVPLETFVFGAAFGYFEAACVAYLRRLDELGQLAVLGFPLANRLLLIEVGREAASLVLLAAWAWAAGRTAGERTGHFALAFGLWDLLYYLFLRLTIGWPERLGEWDILFLIPAPWYGPVVTPVLVSGLLVAGGWGVIVGERAGRRLRFGPAPLALLGSGAVALLGAFLWNAGVREPFPERFPWALFWVGWGLAAAGTFVTLASMRAPGERS